MESGSLSGGCACGRVRYLVSATSHDAYLCHCRMCQRAVGNISVAFVNVARTSVTWIGEPDWYRSSAIAQRPFCSACGTSLGFRYDDGPKMDLTVASFDDPAFFRPTSQFGIEGAHGAWRDLTGVPVQRADEDAWLNRRWEDANGRPD